MTNEMSTLVVAKNDITLPAKVTDEIATWVLNAILGNLKKKPSVK